MAGRNVLSPRHIQGVGQVQGAHSFQALRPTHAMGVDGRRHGRRRLVVRGGPLMLSRMRWGWRVGKHHGWNVMVHHPWTDVVSGGLPVSAAPEQRHEERRYRTGLLTDNRGQTDQVDPED